MAATAQTAEPVAAPASAAASASPLAKPLPQATAHKPLVPSSLTGSLAWRDLSQTHRDVLGPLEKDWDQLDSARKSKWLEVAIRFPTLPPMEQARLRVRMVDWSRMTPAERQQARVGFRDTQKLHSDALNAKWEAYQALPAERRQALLEKAALKKQAQIAATELNAKKLMPRPVTHTLNLDGPSVLQAKPGATTVLITQLRRLPAQALAAKQPKIITDPALVDQQTLLPKRQANNGR